MSSGNSMHCSAASPEQPDSPLCRCHAATCRYPCSSATSVRCSTLYNCSKHNPLLLTVVVFLRFLVLERCLISDYLIVGVAPCWAYHGWRCWRLGPRVRWGGPPQNVAGDMRHSVKIRERGVDYPDFSYVSCCALCKMTDAVALPADSIHCIY